jgi:hypothetical protein
VASLGKPDPICLSCGLDRRLLFCEWPALHGFPKYDCHCEIERTTETLTLPLFRQRLDSLGVWWDGSESEFRAPLVSWCGHSYACSCKRKQETKKSPKQPWELAA